MTAPFPPGALVAAYLRDSGGDAQDLSVEQQETQIRAWCADQQLVLRSVFRDEAARGSSTVGRDAFLRMVDYFNREAPEAGIVVWKFSRIAREFDDAQFYKASLRRRGYVIHSLNENIPEGLDGRFFEAAIDWMNARFLKDLTEDVKRGIYHNVQLHGSLGGTPPRGFRPSAPIDLGLRRNGKPHIVHRWEPDPEMAPLVLRAFQMRASGASLREISLATGLYRSPGSWSHFFANPIYIGRLAYGETVIEDYCEPIVDPDTWQAVQMRLGRRLAAGGDPGQHPRALASDYILTGLLRCARCGSPMTGETIHSKAKNHTNRYYCCTARKRGTCRSLQIPKDAAEQTVLEELVSHILTVDNLLSLRHEAVGQADIRIAAVQARLTQLYAQATDLRVQLDRLTEAIAQIGVTRSVLDKITAREAELREVEIQTEAAELEQRSLEAQATDTEITDLSDRLRQVLRTSDRHELRRWLHTLIHHIEISRENKKLAGTIFYFAPDELLDKTGQFMSMDKSQRRVSIHRHKFNT